MNQEEFCIYLHFLFSLVAYRHLLRGGALNVRDVGSWWLAIPGAGLFMKHFVKGKTALALNSIQL